MCIQRQHGSSPTWHDVVPVARIGLAQASDEEILRVAQETRGVLVTRDRDFGNLVFVESLDAGVICLRVLPSTQKAVHAQLEVVLDTYSEEEFTRSFVVVEPRGHGMRWLPRG